MDKLNLREKTLVYLSRYSYIDPNIEFSAPLDITQDGVAMALGLTRAHASSVLRRMVERGSVICGQARVKGSPSAVKRKVYFLSPQGSRECREILETARSEGLDEREVILPRDINRFGADAIAGMDPVDRDLVGMVCALRSPVRREDIPRTDAIPFDFRGYSAVKEDTRRRVMSWADESDVRRWHSFAADWCTDHGGDTRERLYHLQKAGRIREARLLASEHAFEISDSGGDEPYRIMRELSEDSGDARLLYTSCLMAIRRGDTASAHELAGKAGEIDPCIGGSLESEVLVSEGRIDEAVGVALDSYRGDAGTALALGKCLVEAGRPSEAVPFLKRSRQCMVSDGCLYRMDDVLSYESMANEDLGEKERADALKDMASCMRRGTCL